MLYPFSVIEERPFFRLPVYVEIESSATGAEDEVLSCIEGSQSLVTAVQKEATRIARRFELPVYVHVRVSSLKNIEVRLALNVFGYVLTIPVLLVYDLLHKKAQKEHCTVYKEGKKVYWSHSANPGIWRDIVHEFVLDELHSLRDYFLCCKDDAAKVVQNVDDAMLNKNETG